MRAGVVRTLWNRQIRVEEEGIQTLVVGASAFELRQWANHGHVNFWMPRCEAKDGGRPYLHMARAAMTGKLKGPDRAPLEKRLGKKGLRRTDYAQAKLATLSQFVRYYEDACVRCSPRKSVSHLT